jgi:hypothetical protein
VQPSLAELEVVVAELDRLADPEPRLGEEDEEEKPLVRDPRQELRELVLGQRLHFVVGLGGELVGWPADEEAQAGRGVRANEPFLDRGREQSADGWQGALEHAPVDRRSRHVEPAGGLVDREQRGDVADLRHRAGFVAIGRVREP